jgi:hypothetical protein
MGATAWFALIIGAGAVLYDVPMFLWAGAMSDSTSLIVWTAALQATYLVPVTVGLNLTAVILMVLTGNEASRKRARLRDLGAPKGWHR